MLVRDVISSSPTLPEVDFTQMSPLNVDSPVVLKGPILVRVLDPEIVTEPVTVKPPSNVTDPVPKLNPEPLDQPKDPEEEPLIK